MSQHRDLNLLGGAVVVGFGAVAMSAVDIQAGSTHGMWVEKIIIHCILLCNNYSYRVFPFRVGITVFTVAGFQIALGILAIWALANVESAATGIVLYLRHLHFYLGGALLIIAW